MRLVVLSDASFAFAPNLKSQIGYVMLMADNSRCANTVHYALGRYHRLLRSVMAAEVHSLVHALDMGMVVKKTLSELLHLNVEMETYVDS